MKRPIFIFLLFIAGLSCGQNTQVIVSAKVIGDDGKPMSNVMVINKRTSSGFIAEIDGSFRASALQNDTLAILCRGFNDVILSFRDSAFSPSYIVTIKLSRKIYKPKDKPVNPNPPEKKNNAGDPKTPKDSIKHDSVDDYFSSDAHKLKQVTIYGTKTPEEIRKEIDNLGVENTDDYKSHNSLASPITALYERFSKREQDKRKVAELEHDDRRKEVLRDLLVLYIDYNIIELTDDEFDEFLNGLYLPDEVLKSYSDYKLGEYVKKQYISYREYKKQHKDYDDTVKKFNGGN